MRGALGLPRPPVEFSTARLVKGKSPIVVAQVEKRRPAGDAPYGHELRGAISVRPRKDLAGAERARERGDRFERAFEDVRQRAAAQRLERNAIALAERERRSRDFAKAQAAIGAPEIERRRERAERDLAFAKAQKDIRDKDRRDRREEMGHNCKERPKDSRKGGGSGKSFVPWCRHE